MDINSERGIFATIVAASQRRHRRYRHAEASAGSYGVQWYSAQPHISARDELPCR